MNFYGNPAPVPEGLSLAARLAWKYFFDNGWAITRTADGVYIVTDESRELDSARIFPDDDALLDWLERTTDCHMEDDSEDFIRTFVTVPELASESVVEAAKALLDCRTE